SVPAAWGTPASTRPRRDALSQPLGAAPSGNRRASLLVSSPTSIVPATGGKPPASVVGAAPAAGASGRAAPAPAVRLPDRLSPSPGPRRRLGVAPRPPRHERDLAAQFRPVATRSVVVAGGELRLAMDRPVGFGTGLQVEIAEVQARAAV